MTSCEGASTIITTWNPTGMDILVWKTVYDIEYHTLPTLQSLLDEQILLLSDTTISAQNRTLAEGRKTQLTNAITGWNGLLNRTAVCILQARF